MTSATSALLEKALETVSKPLGAGSLQGSLRFIVYYFMGPWEPLCSHDMNVMLCAGFVSACVKKSEAMQGHADDMVPSETEGVCHGLGGDRRS